MKVVTFQGPEPKVVEDARQRYLLIQEGCHIRVQDAADMEIPPGGQFLSADRFWEAVARVTGIVVTDSTFFRGSAGYGTQDLVMRLAAALGFIVYAEKSNTGAFAEADGGTKTGKVEA